LSACTLGGRDKNEQDFLKINDSLVDSNATVETVALYENLQRTASDGIMFGHQDDLADQEILHPYHDLTKQNKLYYQ
jgi:hypothetical protein|tara:strand:- start:2589 stop:2819 length:231 start_codon:yes stop_codon:yes gene_type:complete